MSASRVITAHDGSSIRSCHEVICHFKVGYCPLSVPRWGTFLETGWQYLWAHPESGDGSGSSLSMKGWFDWRQQDPSWYATILRPVYRLQRIKMQSSYAPTPVQTARTGKQILGVGPYPNHRVVKRREAF